MTAYLPEGLIIKAILVLGWSPKLQPDKEPFKQGDETYKEDCALTVPAAGIEVKAYCTCKDSQRHTQSDGDEETTDVKYSKPDRSVRRRKEKQIIKQGIPSFTCCSPTSRDRFILTLCDHLSLWSAGQDALSIPVDQEVHDCLR